MGQCNAAVFRRHALDAKDRWAAINRACDLEEILPSQLVSRLLDEHGPDFRDRIFPPDITLWAFLSQIFSADHSCREAVIRLATLLESQGKKGCSTLTGSYCKARQRLPEQLVVELAKHTGQELEAAADAAWRWKGRPVKLLDGSSVSMPDCAANQDTYPQPKDQKPGVGFPLARLVAIISLASGALLDFAMGPWAGDETGEHALLRRILGQLASGDVVLGDAYYCSFYLIQTLMQMGVDVVFPQHGGRLTDFRKGQRLANGDHIVTWIKPHYPPDWMDRETWAALPKTMLLRETKVTINKKGYRSKTKILVTTLLDPKTYDRGELGALYDERWRIELNLRSIKQVLQMDVLRCKSPSMVRKEVWMHLLAYNLIRKIMAAVAMTFRLPLAQISFKASLQAMNAFRQAIPFMNSKASRTKMFADILAHIRQHKVGLRPGRVEPREKKRRPKGYPWLKVPRDKARQRILRRCYP